MQVSAKQVVLTGASGGIGGAMARSLDAAGARLILVGRDSGKLEALRGQLSGSGHRVVAAELTAAEGRAAVREACADGVDVLINNAGVNHFGLFDQQTEYDLRRLLEVNAVAPILLTRLLMPLLATAQGTIVNVGSGYGRIGFPGYCAYSASKYALRGFTEALRRELAGTGVNVQLLSPRAVATGMNPPEVVAMNEELGNGTDSPEQVADALLTLLSSGRRELQLGRPERFFGLINHVLPGLVDRALRSKLPVVRRQAMAVQSHAS